MLIISLRSSSFSSHSFCPQQYFCEYTLGIKSQPNKKTIMGSITHRVLEALAKHKLAIQNNETYTDELVGIVKTSKIDKIVEVIYQDHVSKYPKHLWEPIDLGYCQTWVDKVLDSPFNPLKRKIVAVEQKFEFPIKSDWGKYRYEEWETPVGVGALEGQLVIHGTCDLITELEPGLLEIIDFKTGKRKDWGTDKIKDFDYLLNDSQLRIYHYVLSHLYSQNILMTIYFINDGGAFCVPFDKKDLVVTEGIIKDKFQVIKRTQLPKLNKSWKCTKFCYFGTHNVNGVKTANYDDSMCTAIHKAIKTKGMDNVVKEYTAKDFKLDDYNRGE